MNVKESEEKTKDMPTIEEDLDLKYSILVTIKEFLDNGGDLSQKKVAYIQMSTDDKRYPMGLVHQEKNGTLSFESFRGEEIGGSMDNKVQIEVKPLWK